MSDDILKGSDKWNERLRIYANYVAKNGALGRDLEADLANDRYGIAWIAAPTYKLAPQLKVLAISSRTGGQCIPYTMATVHDRTLSAHQSDLHVRQPRQGWRGEADRAGIPALCDQPQGQEAVERDGKYLPLTAAVAQEQSR